MIYWPKLKLKPINLWNLPIMTPKEIVALSQAYCNRNCKIDIWQERCNTCNKTLIQIEETYERSKTAEYSCTSNHT